MYPEDRVLIAVMPQVRDLDIAREQGWYRIPVRYAPKGLYAEYYAFYFGRPFGSDKWAIHYFARQLGYELVTRRDLFPEESDHSRANDQYFKISLGPLQKLDQPIISLRRRRITFIHTTWDRFASAREISDLFLVGDELVDRLYATLRDQGLNAQKGYLVKEGNLRYRALITIFCRDGRVDVNESMLPFGELDFEIILQKILDLVAQKGGST